MQQFVKDYYNYQALVFHDFIESTIEMIDKCLEMEGDYKLKDHEKDSLKAFRLLFTGQLVDDIQQNLNTGQVTEETVEKRVRLEEEMLKFIKDRANLPPIGKILLDYIMTNYLSKFRNSLLFELRMFERGISNANESDLTPNTDRCKTP